ncbi:uncharacterized protein V6R79_026259 [Siganus canaliculatus]
MRSRKKSFFGFWRNQKENRELLERTSRLRLQPPQLGRLLGDGGLRTELQNVRMVSLLPPAGAEAFRRFTADSLEKQQKEAGKKDTEVKDQAKPSRHLEAGKPLPFIYGDPPLQLRNTPLEELDPFYQSQKTFVVLDRGHTIYRFNADSAYFLLSPLHPLRKASIRILFSSLFHVFMLLTVLLNCGLLAVRDPPTWSGPVQLFFTAVYFLELLLKVSSRGFCLGHFTFLRDPWNWLDVVVVITGSVSLFVSLGSFRALGSVALVLKLIPLCPGQRVAVGAVVQSVKRLAGVAVLTLVCLSIFAVISMQFVMGSMKHKCILWPPSDLTDGYHGNQTGSFDFDQYKTNKSNQYFLPGQLEALLCGNYSNAGACPDGFTCIKAGQNPHYGYTNFDSFGWSLLAHFRLMTQDFWENLFQQMLRVEGRSFVLYFLVVIFPGSFLLVSLIVGVVAMAFSESEEEVVAEAKQMEKDFRQILEALKRKEEEQAASGGALSEEVKKDSEKSTEENHTTTEGGQRSVFRQYTQGCRCCGCWCWLRQKLHAVVVHPLFDLFIVLCLIINTVFMSLVHFPLTYEFAVVLEVANLVFLGIFTAEMILKLVAMDPCSYFKVPWNIFDGALVVCGLLELFLPYVYRITAMRVFRLARWWPDFHRFLKVVWSALRSLMLLLVIVVFAFTVAGMQLFHRDYDDCVCRISADCQLPRWHMNDFFHTFLLVVRVLFGEWIECLWDCMEVSGQTMCLAFFMTLLLIGKLLVLNLFLMLSLGLSSCVDQTEAEEKLTDKLKTWRWTLLGKKHPVPIGAEDTRKEELTLDLVTSDQGLSDVKTINDNQEKQTRTDQDDESQRAPMAPAEEEVEPRAKEDVEYVNNENNRHPDVQLDGGDHEAVIRPDDCCCRQCYGCCPCLDMDSSRGAGKAWSHTRKACLAIVRHKAFDVFFIVVIVLNSAARVFEDVHLQHRPLLRTVVETSDQVFTYLFLLEMLLKWLAFGLRKYFSSGWHWLDFLLLDVSLVSLAMKHFGFSGVSGIQFLVPLRILSRFQGPRLVVQLLLRSIPSIFAVLLVFLTVWLFFSIVGMQMFAGKFYYCFNETSEEIFDVQEVPNKTDCLSLIWMNFTEVRWKGTSLNYNSVGNGYLSLLLLAMATSWPDIMYAAVDATEVESQPVYENNIYVFLYYICFVIIGCFFAFVVFIRTILSYLQRQQVEGRHIFMTEWQQKLSQAIKNLFSRKPTNAVPRPQTRCLARLFDLVTNRWFEVAIMVVICLNIVLLMVETDDQSMEKDFILHWAHLVIIVIFLIEFILKIVALKQHYFRSGWNVLDFVVLIACITGLFLGDIIEKYFISPTLFMVVRLPRIGRIFHLIRWSGRVRKLLLAFVMSLPALFNISAVLFVLWFTSSLFGMYHFAHVQRKHMMDDMYNFETFANSMINVLMISPTSSWNGMLLPIMEVPPDCDPFEEFPGMPVTGNCGNPTVGILFFVTYILLFCLLVIHLYVAVILQLFASEDGEVPRDKDLNDFCKTWKKFDPEASQFIEFTQLSGFCDALKEPLKVPKASTIRLDHMDLPLFPGDKVHCVDLLVALTAQAYGDAAEMDSLKARMEERLGTSLSKELYEPISSTLSRKRAEVAATVI